MLDIFLYSVNSVVPIFIVVVLGWVIKKTRFLDQAFFSGADKFVFNFALPAMLFIDFARMDSIPEFDFGFVLFVCCAVVIVFVVLCLTVPVVVKDNAKRGAFIQGVYRANFAILGSSILKNMFGDDAVPHLALIMPVAVIMFNVLAVVVLSMFAPADKKESPGVLAKNILINILKNPLIISLVLGVIVMLIPFRIPELIEKPVSYFSDATLALALVSLGANIDLEKLKKTLKMSIFASALKTVAVPAAVVSVAVLMGFRGVQLGTIFIVFGSPTAVSSYIMAKNMGSDYTLASQILLISTLMSLFTLFGGIFLIKSLGLI